MHHETTVIRTNMGRYKVVCTCGWEGPVISKGKAMKQARNHRKDKAN